MSDLKITSSEKTKNPKRVEQGKRLAAISREAKERKKLRQLEQEKFFESVEDDGNRIFFVIGLIGAGVLLYKIFLDPEDREDREDPSDRENSEDARPPQDTKPAKPVDPSDPSEDAKPEDTSEPRRKRSYEPYTMD